MRSLISHQGAFAMLQIELEKGEIIKAESGAIVSKVEVKFLSKLEIQTIF